MVLSQEEKAAVSRILFEKQSLAHVILSWSAFLIPTLIMAIYGFMNEEYVAVTTAYGLLLGLVIWYSFYSDRYYRKIRSALEKYEAEVKALSGTES